MFMILHNLFIFSERSKRKNKGRKLVSDEFGVLFASSELTLFIRENKIFKFAATKKLAKQLRFCMKTTFISQFVIDFSLVALHSVVGL